MNKLFANKKFLGITSLVLATSMVVGTIAIRRSKNSKGIEVGVPQVLADSNYLDYDSSSQVNYSTVLGRAVDYDESYADNFCYQSLHGWFGFV